MRGLIAAIAAGALAAACSSPRDDRAAVVAVAPPETATRAPGPPPRAISLPRDGAAFPPSQLDLASDTAAPSGVALTDVETCEGCHADAAAQWRSSAHAFASFNNPVYRYAVERFRDDVGKSQSHFCAGCHDVSLMVDRAMLADVAPDDVRGHTGVACRICHGVTRTRPDGNGSFTLRGDAIPLPKKGDDESLRVHKEQAALKPLRSAELCGSCHRSFVGEPTGNPSHLTGMDELTGWSQSIYAGSLLARIDDEVPEADCRGCHMPKEPAPLGDVAAHAGTIASHRFLGAHTWMAAMRRDPAQLAEVRRRLEGAASIDIAAVTHANGARDPLAEGVSVSTGDTLTFDVVVRNQRVGHRFPGGTLDAQDVWIEVVVRDARGRVLAEAGARHEDDGDDLTAHRLRAVQADESGVPQLARETHHFRAVVTNHTLAPRDAEVVRYAWTVPPLGAGALPIRVTARLRHRSRNLFVARAACAEVRTKRGAAYREQSPRLVGQNLDACIVQPITDVATRDAWIGAGWEGRAAPSPTPAWRRRYDHALGLLHGVQENVGEARPGLERALTEVTLPRERAMIASLFAQIAEREGRTDEVMAWLDRAEADLPGHPAIAAIRGAALASVWRWDEAIGPLRDGTRAAPGDSSAWSRLAVAAGSRGDEALALESCARGLALQPRDADMLRVHALALAAFDVTAADRDAPRDAYLRYRSPDAAPRIKSACAKNVPGCALERIPVHTHVLRSR
jgi:hypothetical protein